MERSTPRRVHGDELWRWQLAGDGIAGAAATIGRGRPSARHLERDARLPLHLQLLAQAGCPRDLVSISFRDLAAGFFLPAAALPPATAGALLGYPPPPAPERWALAEALLERDLGLLPSEAIACLLGDPFGGRRAGLADQSLVRLAAAISLQTKWDVERRVVELGSLPLAIAELRPQLRELPGLTAAELLAALALAPELARGAREALLRELFARCDRLEAWALARLLLRQGFGYGYQTERLSALLAQTYGAPADAVAQALALTDPFEVCRRLARGGAEALLELRLQPLVPVRPAQPDAWRQPERWPQWVEPAPGGLRLVLHKLQRGSEPALVAAFSTRGRDWIEALPGLAASLRWLPSRQLILDGELLGWRAGGQPLSRESAWQHLRGERQGAVRWSYRASDLLFLDGAELTRQPWQARRALLERALATAPAWAAVPIAAAPGGWARTASELAYLLRRHEDAGASAIDVKDGASPYALGAIDPGWRRQRAASALQLAVLALVIDAAGAPRAAVLGAQGGDGALREVAEAQLSPNEASALWRELERQGLRTGRQRAREGRGVEAGELELELRPALLLEVSAGAIEREPDGQLRLRDVRLLSLRRDRGAADATSLRALRELAEARGEERA